MKNMIIFGLTLLVLLSTAYAATSTSSGGIPNQAEYAAMSSATALSANLVNQDPDPALAGDLMEVRIGVTNRGGLAANKVVVEIVPTYPFSIPPGEPSAKSIGTIQGYQGKYDVNVQIVSLKLRTDISATAGTYDLKVKYYENGTNTASQATVPIRIKNRESAEVIHIDKTTLVPGKISPLKFTINNVGNAPLSDLTFNWVNSDKVILPVGSDNTRYIRYIEVGDGMALDYNVIADSSATPGLYSLDLFLTYKDASNASQEKKIQTLAGVYVGGETDFAVAFSDSSNGQTSFSVANIGANPASSVSISIPNQRNWQVTGSNSMIIGNLNKGDYTVASFNIQSPNTNVTGNRTGRPGAQSGSTGQGNFPAQTGMPDQGNLPTQGFNPPDEASNDSQNFARRFMNRTGNTILVDIEYTDTMGNRKMVEKEVTMGSSSGSAGGFARRTAATTPTTSSWTDSLNQYKWYILIGIMVVVGYLIFEKRKTAKILSPVIAPPVTNGKKK